ncbi:MAG: hydroxyacylglutathione hydrolase [Gammaproteobacteria bacterium]|nr:hydroxyacylglutathione hydrolase [Gammaproteobacteria bacterium]
MLNITPIRAFSDNYIWMIQRDKLPQVALVDPGQSKPVIKHLQENNLQPVAILITHQHYDHTGGVAELLEKYPQISVIGPARDPSENKLSIDLPVPDLITQKVNEGDVVKLPELDISFEVISVPGHTLDHLAYYGEERVFCGDLLFGAGCGRIFSGTPQMFAASIEKIMALPDDTLMYCAHEYTVDNLGFAKWVEPESRDIIERDETEMKKQEQGISTVPGSLALELKTNPFVRLQQPLVKQAAESFAGSALHHNWQIFAALREWKDSKYD